MTEWAAHFCHAEGCREEVPPRLFMCRKHWFSLPRKMRDAVNAVYVTGQEVRRDPTPEYMRVTREAIEWLAAKEGRR